jgi:hypothetical protein
VATVFVPGVFRPGVFTVDVVVAVVVDIDVGPPGAAKHRTALGSDNTQELVSWPASSPWAPYDAQSLMVIWNHMGIYVFGKRMPPDAIQALAFHVAATLKSVSSVTFAAEPIGANLLGSVSAGQRPTGSCVISNVDGWWNKRVNDEAFMAMGCGHFVLIRGLWYFPVLTGTIGSINLEEDDAIISFGMFASDQPTEKVWFI